mmetsp:Transcript_28520/g.43850  ORF Transcript_28520/g.43850 Transcript_28520/m.43850 type:complete len:562 (+) Transcript_28520:133-1818(+)|eukprot:CAMPEP_0118685328 /NCGR_PEP_ID=MMETSP0800-20121206/7176_1 /TAXON_ID=210618 ORGANISM="Striatella unipunctata, Strain CCMP2910" /NCGR_SAMPLE_ID=MMETSP0800 /ASSEMBLY_ACC=CAM_ASM_000638 /LENGTH=561 /DNA_ID=CAMNT_0006582209 /DNA_START=114 /DNA_END=1799 /DNA_ORIENTATION=+
MKNRRIAWKGIIWSLLLLLVLSGLMLPTFLFLGFQVPGSALEWTRRYDSFSRVAIVSIDSIVNQSASTDVHDGGWNVLSSQWQLVSPMVESNSIHPTSRYSRFPNVTERVRLYMGPWYYPPCLDSHKTHFEYGIEMDMVNPNLWWRYVILHVPPSADANETRVLRKVDSTLRADRIFYPELNILLDCARSDRQVRLDTHHKVQTHMLRYCRDAIQMISMLDEVQGSTVSQIDPSSVSSARPKCEKMAVNTASNGNGMLSSLSGMPDVVKSCQSPLLLQFGDSLQSQGFRHLPVPVIRKFRKAVSKEEYLQFEYDTTEKECPKGDRLWKVIFENDEYHPGVVWKLEAERHFRPLIRVRLWDVPWEKKQDKGVWRGVLTGVKGMERNLVSSSPPNEICHSIDRCRIVKHHSDSKILDVGLTDTFGWVPNEIDGVTLIRPPVSIERQLTFKIIIMINGNDVPSGLKWALYSNSVVLYQNPPPYTTWAMEELLEPWVHFVPLDENLADVEQQAMWVLKNPSKAKLIAERATLFMYDLVYHPDADRDEHEIKMEILRRYRQHFAAI